MQSVVDMWHSRAGEMHRQGWDTLRACAKIVTSFPEPEPMTPFPYPSPSRPLRPGPPRFKARLRAKNDGEFTRGW